MIKGKKAGSWIPFIGGGSISLAMAISPLDVVADWWWVPLLIDWGSVPGVGFAIFYHAFRILKKVARF